MRDWDDERIEDRTFKVGGELFEWIYPHWEISGMQMNESYGLAPPAENGDSEEPPQFSWVDDTKYAIERIPRYLKNEDHKRFKALVARKTDPVPRYQLVLIYKWLVEVTNNLPTTPPSEHSAGGGEADTSSSEESSSPAVTSTT